MTSMFKQAGTVLQAMRLPFLLLTLAMMLLVSAIATYEGFEWSLPLFFLICVAALAAHLSVNLLNEFEDFESGLDFQTDKTPFSGGSGGLPANPAVAESVAAAGYFFLGMVISLGGFFVYLRDWSILPLGLLGVVLIVTYTSHITRYPWLCLIAPGLAFGPFMVVGGFMVLTGEFSWLAFWVSWIPFLLVNNLLLLNQFPDEAADRRLGRFNIIMRLGREGGLRVFKSFLVLSYLALAYLIIDGWLPYQAAFGFLSLLLVVPLWQKLRTPAPDLIQLMPALGINVAVVLTMPVLIAVGLYQGLS
ncbi:prenyltransferase [Hydrogenovibrio thermophilus]|uniref:Prenyltransferase n=2 Tax=Hydrogenovibrio thermophilus TaxID=265883 RepID=A0A410H3G3_9GAMM|nr:prenyltransferase [Hydrogenovibrio thermophilus]